MNGELIRGYLWSGPLTLIAELDGTGALLTEFFYGTRPNVPDAMRRSGVTYSLVKDLRGSVRLVVNTATGEVIQRLDYDSFGRVQLDSNPGFQPFGFAGGLYDHQTHLVRFGVRDYDPEIGRWLSLEPLLFETGSTNLYAYAHNDPINYVDPDGRIPLPLLTGLIGGGAGLVGNIVGQLVRNRGFDCFSLKETLIAGGVGFAAGAAAPLLAGSLLGAALLGAGANTVQYSATQFANGEGVSVTGLKWSAGTGAVGGAIAGPISRATGLRFSENSPWISRSLGRALNNNADAVVNSGTSNLVRSAGAGVVANAGPENDGPCPCN